jgi:H+-transporting ATPase
MGSAGVDIKQIKGMGVDELLKRLSTTGDGLTSAEAEERLNRLGYNEITEKKKNPLLKLLGYFWGPIPWMIEAAAVISAIIGHWEDFSVISALLLVNSAVGFWQEYKADNAIELLKKKLAVGARVLRDKEWKSVPASGLVPGDVIRLRLGDIVPADAVLIDGDYLSSDESALTGESLPVEKHIGDVCYSGAVVNQGEMDAVVAATGMDTYFGMTARLVGEPGKESHFQKAVVRIGHYLIVMAVLLVSVIFLVGLFRHESAAEILKFALVLIVASIPAALPAVLSVTMAIGATALAAKEAIVSKLVAIEEMAGMDVLCSDKTGTITKNELTVGDVVSWGGSSTGDVMEAAAFASRAEDKDPIDDAVLKQNPAPEGVDVLSFKPFDPVSKMTRSELRRKDGTSFSVAKGAPQAMLDLIENKEAVGQWLEDTVENMAQKGYRSLGVARKDKDGPWQYLGVLALHDPAREDSKDTIQTAQEMGIRVKMVTGDHLAIAREIAGEVGLGGNIVTAESFVEEKDRHARRLVEDADGFAQVYPEHKYQIVELLQDKGHIVGMTGDGVNDAPALKRADVGIAVAGATDAAKTAADIVLTRAGLSVIIDAIKESRTIFQRMNNYSIYRITETIRVLLFITLSILVFNFYPITALMVVLLALLNDAPIMSIAYDNVKYSDAPEKWNLKEVLALATFMGVVGVICSFGVLYIGKHILLLDRNMLQSFIYLKLSVAGQMTVFTARLRGRFWTLKPSPIMVAATLTAQVIATLIVVYGIFVPPLGWRLAGFVWIYATLSFLVLDFMKVRMYSLLESKGISYAR